MENAKITISLSKKDVDMLKQLATSDRVKEIIDNIILEAEKQFKIPSKELTIFQIALLKGLLEINDIPFNIFNFEYQSDIVDLERIGVLSFSKSADLKLLHLNFEYDKEKFPTTDMAYEELKKHFNLKEYDN